jgi:hypothetical protein
MLLEAYALATDRDIVDEAVNPRRLKQQNKHKTSSAPSSTTGNQANQPNSLQINPRTQTTRSATRNTWEVFDEMPRR